MTLNEIIYNLRMQVKDHKSDDLNLTDRNWEFMINYVRAKLISQEIGKNRPISSNLEQDLGKLELEKYKPEGSDCYQYRTVRDIPTPMDIEGAELITSVSGSDFGDRFDFVSKAQAIKRINLKYANKRDVVYYSGNKLHLPYCASELKYIYVTGIFENPREVYDYVYQDDSNKCFDPNRDAYPISQKMIDMLNSIIKNNELNHYFQLIEDKENDGQNIL